MGVVSDLTVRMSADTANLMSGIGSASGAFQGLLGTVGRINPVVGVIAGVAAAAIGLGAASVKAAGDFQSGITTLATGAGESQKNLQMVSDGILSLSTATGTSTKQLTSGMFMIESAGYHGKAGLDVLTAAARGAKVGQADLGVVSDATTTIMTDFASKNVTASQAVNTLIATVSSGKTNMQALASSLSNIMPTASAAGISLTDTSAAMATMTGEGVPAAQAATYLRQMIIGLDAPSKQTTTALSGIGLSTKQVSDEMKVSLPGALQLITDHLKKKFPEGSAAYVNALKDISGGSKNMQGMLDLTGQHLQTFKGNVDNIASSVKKGGDSINGWAQVQQNFNFKMDQAKEAMNVLLIKIGQGLLPVIGNIVSEITPVIVNFTNWITTSKDLHNFLGFLGSIIQSVGAFITQKAIPAVKGIIDAFLNWENRTHTIRDTVSAVVQFITTQFLPTMQKIGTFIMTNVVPALQQFGQFIMTNVIPPLQQFGSFVMTNVVPVFQRIGQFIMTNVVPALQQVGAFIATNFMPALNTVGNFLKTTFEPVWTQLVQIFNSQIRPAFAQLITALQPVWQALLQLWPAVQQLFTALQPLTPVLQMIGTVILGTIVIGLGLLIGVIAGVIKGFAMMLPGIAQAFAGIIQAVTGFVQLVIGSFQTFFGLIQGLATGNWSMFQAGVQNLVSGVVNLFTGLWNTVVGLFNAAFGLINGFISGFVGAVVGFFTNLYDTLVGHSIVPDMINSIVQWFLGLPGKAVAAVMSIIALISGVFNMLWSAGVVIVTNFINGVINIVTTLPGRAASAAQGIIGAISGVLSGLPGMASKWMSDLGSSIIGGINGFIDGVRNAATNVANTISNILHHSTPDEGPLMHDDQWMPDFGQNLARGLNNQVGNVRSAALNIAHAVSAASGQDSSYQYTGRSNTLGMMAAAAQAANGSSDTHIHVHIGNEEIAHYVTNQQMKMVRLGGHRR